MRKHLLLTLALLFSILGGVKGTHIGPFKFTNWDQTGTWTAVSNYKINYPYYTSQENVEFTTGGNLTVTFQWSDGNTRFECLGIDIVNAQGQVVKSDYRHTSTGSGREQRTYTLTDVEAGTYTIRYWSCKFGDDGRDNSGSSNTGSGTITTTYTGEKSTDFTVTGWINKVNGWTACKDNVPNTLCKAIHDANFGSSTNLYWHTDSNLKFYEAGDFNLQFQYANGSWRLDTRGVELLDGDGNVVAANYHEGFTGSQQDHRDYNISVPEAGTYSLRIIVQSSDITSANNSWGTIVYSCTSNPYHYEQYICDMITEHPDMIGWPVPTEEIKEFSTTNRINESNVADFRTKLNAITNINLPQDGHVYRFANYSNYKNGLKRYMTYQNGQALGLKINPSANADFYCRKIAEGKYIFYTNDGNILTWLGTTSGDQGFKQNGTNGWGYSEAYPATQDSKTDWNEISVQKQNNSIDQTGMVKLIGRRNSSSTSVFVPNGTNETWDRADNTSFFQTNGSYHTSAFFVEEITDGAVLGHAKGEAKYVSSKYPVGTNLGQYTFTDNVGNKTTNVAEAIDACSSFDEANTVVHSIAINLPENGFYRFKGHINGRYITSSDANVRLGLPATRANDVTEIFYVAKEGEQYTILNYTNGLYWNVNNTSTVGGTKSLFTFREAIDNSQNPLIGQYWIQSNNSYNDVLQPWNNGEPQISNAHKNYDNQSGWDIEKVESLPISIATSGYTTMYSPVSLTLPGELEAYTADVDEGRAVVTYTKVSEVPANTGVLLYRTSGKSESATPHVLGTNGTTIAQSSDLKGEAYTQAYNSTANTVAGEPLGDAYVYTLQSGKFKWYTGTKLTGFKAHLELEDGRETGNARTYTFTFDDNDPTGITEIDGMIESNASIYDLSGRKMTRLQKGINIVNGKKVIR